MPDQTPVPDPVDGPSAAGAPGSPAPGSAVPATARGLRGQFAAFVAIGAVTTAAYFLAYNLLREVLPPLTANSLSVVGSIWLSFIANKRFTFGPGAGATTRQLALFLVIFGVTLAASNAGLAVLPVIVDDPGRLAENAVLLAANGLLVIVRFWLVRTYVFR